MKLQAPRFRNKVMLLCGVLTAGMIAAPGAFARDHNYSRYSGYHDYHRHGWHDHNHGSNVGALLAGAIIGGVIVNALDNSQDYSRTYYAPAPSGYYYNDGYGSYGGSRYTTMATAAITGTATAPRITATVISRPTISRPTTRRATTTATVIDRRLQD